MGGDSGGIFSDEGSIFSWQQTQVEWEARYNGCHLSLLTLLIRIIIIGMDISNLITVIVTSSRILV